MGFSSPRTSWGLQRHVLSQILKIFFFVLGALVLVYALFLAVGVSRDYNLDFLLVLPVIWTIGLAMLKDVMPLSLLFAASLVYGRVVADREVMALKSFGLSYRQLLQPALLLGLLFTPIGFFVTGYLGPEMNYRKQNIGSLMLAQLRYLGEGWNKDLPFGDKSLWIMHHDGRRLDGIFFTSQTADAQDLLPEDVSRRLNPSLGKVLFLFAERANILFPEDLVEAGRAPEPAAAGGGESSPPRRTGVVFELHNVSLFLKNEILTKETSNFHQRMHFDRLPVTYDPSRTKKGRRRRHEVNHVILNEMRQARKRGDEASMADYHVLSTEFHTRLAWTLSLFVYPLLAGVVALFLNSEDRLKPFFFSILLAPLTFYGLAMVGRMLGRSGSPAWITMQLGNIALGGLVLLGYYLLEKRLLR